MKLLTSMEQLASIEAPISWALGFFDGIHMGHQGLINAAKLLAKHRGYTGIITFEQHPKRALAPDMAPLLLTPSNREKQVLLEQMGIDIMLMLSFDEQLRQLSAQEFLDCILQHSTPLGISIGENCRFGAKGLGNADCLKLYADAHGFSAQIVPLYQANGIPCSSTQARLLLGQGDMAGVAHILGRPFSITGTVEHGQELARQLGFPTANIAVCLQAALPPFGVYFVQAYVKGVLLKGVASLGQRPTIVEQHKQTRLEVHFLDWEGDLYGEEIQVQLVELMRHEEKFENLEALKRAIKLDIETARNKL